MSTKSIDCGRDATLQLWEARRTVLLLASAVSTVVVAESIITAAIIIMIGDIDTICEEVADECVAEWQYFCAHCH